MRHNAAAVPQLRPDIDAADAVVVVVGTHRGGGGVDGDGGGQKRGFAARVADASVADAAVVVVTM